MTAPSIQVLAQTRERRRTIPDSIQGTLVVGDPAPMPGDFRPLKYAKEEAHTIAQMLSVQPLIGPMAKEAVIKEKLADARIIHMATHGIFNEKNPLEGALALVHTDSENTSSDTDGWLTAAEILDTSLNAELVVLSACDTGQGRITGDGVIGLSRSFLGAGASSVLASLWEVPDKSTSELMIEFYRQHDRGLDSAQALRQAMLQTKQTYPDPTQWAAFTFMGAAE